ncbi:MAG: hypothetical protein C5B53_11660 [Candidatus Melainabacteria bacterium]|nr:MAG: hypothetical protein C5B53_11660 [Candidatus Melainabacteria bacterium]
MKRPVLLRTRALALCLFFTLATVPIIYGAKEFQTIASWYGPGFQGRRTANGERFDQEAMTAASKTLPFGTRVVVYNPRNGRQCVVTINDRGPYVPGRGIDLSHAAARKLGIGGVAPVICYAGGTAYSDIAQKDHLHKHVGPREDKAPLAVPAPSQPSDSSNVALDNQSASSAPVPHLSSSKQAMIASIPPQSAEPVAVAQSSPASQPQISNAAAPAPRTSVGRAQVNEQAIAQLNHPSTEAPSQSNYSVGRTIQAIKLQTPEVVASLPPVVRNTSKAVEHDLPRISDAYEISLGRKPGTLLAAAMATPAIDQTPALPPHEIVNNAVQYQQVQIARTSMLPQYVEVQNPPPTINTTPIEVPRTVKRAAARTYVVAHHRHIRYARHSHFRASHGGDLVDHLTYKITHVCKKILASL